MKINKYFILIAGPTGVGKTEFAEKLALNSEQPIEIVNIDQGQFYTPLNIGTAKPDNIENQHLFNIIDEPVNLTVLDYRKALIECLDSLWNRGVLPVLVGGSGFYIKSIFFPPKSPESILKEEKEEDFSSFSTQDLFQRLKNIDIERAISIDPNDRYRIERALSIWQKTGKKPSELKPVFDPIGTCSIYYLNRQRDDLYKRIDSRVIQMIKAGWLKEVKQLDSNWYDFLKTKKIIGYSEIIDFIINGELEKDREQLIELISQKSRVYAKKQLTFWRSLYKILNKSDYKEYIKKIIEVDLSDKLELGKIEI